MSAVNVTINGVICDLYGRTITGPVKIVGEMMYTDLAPGHPLPPGEKPPTGLPPGIWPGPGDPDYPIKPPPGQGPGGPWVPAHPGPILPGDPGWGPPYPERPPTDVEIPPPGSPPVVLPGTSPVNPMVPPPAIVVNYPGVGKVLVPLPVVPSEEPPPSS